jgi:hypothetical protein
MTISRKKVLYSLALCLGFSFVALSPAMAQATIGGVKFEPEATVGGQKLQLNGTGMRFRLGFRVYAAGLYTPGKVTQNDEVTKPSVTKRMHLVAQRDVKGDEFGRLFSRAMEDNASKEEFSKMINGVLRMGTLFAEAKQFAKGDVILLDYVPGVGTSINFRGKQQGEPIKEPEFGTMMYKIWFGAKPADEALRRALLGEQTTANTNVN